MVFELCSKKKERKKKRKKQTKDKAIQHSADAFDMKTVEEGRNI